MQAGAATNDDTAGEESHWGDGAAYREGGGCLRGCSQVSNQRRQLKSLIALSARALVNRKSAIFPLNYKDSWLCNVFNCCSSYRKSARTQMRQAGWNVFSTYTESSFLVSGYRNSILAAGDFTEPKSGLLIDGSIRKQVSKRSTQLRDISLFEFKGAQAWDFSSLRF